MLNCLFKWLWLIKQLSKVFNFFNCGRLYPGIGLLCASMLSFLLQIVESDKTCELDCNQINEEMEMQILDENHVMNKSKEKVQGASHILVYQKNWLQPSYYWFDTIFDTLYVILSDSRSHKMGVHHLPKRHIALKVMYFGQRYISSEMLNCREW